MPVELGELSLNGQFIDRLLFVQHQANPPFTVVLDAPEPTVKIPVGSYAGYHVYLKENQTVAFRDYRERQRTTSISATNTSVLSVGGPLTNSVLVSSHGSTLSLDYQLRGADGLYTKVGSGRTNAPRFAIYQGGKQVSSGTFEYG